jgi:CheY-like chemotaxis protein
MKGARILMVDDHPGNLKLLSFILTKHGYDLRVAVDAVQALAVLEDFRPQLILMDLQLPGMDGLELTRRLKANPLFRDVVIVAVTASAMKGDEQRAKDAGCDGYITKPLDTRVLPELVDSYLANHARPNS